MTDETQLAEAPAAGGLPRRQALCGVLALGVLGPTALAACSSEKEFGQPSGSATSGAAAPSEGAADGGIAKLSEIPKGGGKVVTAPDGQPVVIVHANDGTVKGYSAKCTHQGVTVNPPENGVITCPKHNSQFNAIDGSVANAPATAPLAPVTVQVQGDDIHLA